MHLRLLGLPLGYRRNWQPRRVKGPVARFAVGCLMVAAICSPTVSAQVIRPNVIIVMADDFGYETVGANGGTSYHTPHLDALAATGMRFTQAYVQPLCTPTRLQLMTGAYNVRNYVNFGEMDAHLRTFGHLFREAGYVTGMVGKWQLGRQLDLPQRLGFDEYTLWQHLRRPPRYANPGLEYQGEARDFSHGEYGPDLINQAALDFITRHRQQPFFLYYSMLLTHSPYQPTPDSDDWDPAAVGEEVHQAPEHFADMVEYTDKLVGKVVAHLESLELRQRTLIVFLGDNGTGRGTVSHMGDRKIVGGKGSTTDAGMHVPLIASWPGHVVPGRQCNDLVDSTDILPTICQAAAVDVPREMTTDGYSFWSQLRGEPGHPRPWVYCWYSPRGEPAIECVFDHSWKVYRDGRSFRRTDDLEKHAVDLPTLDPLATAHIAELGKVFDRYGSARPAHLPPRTAAP